LRAVGLSREELVFELLGLEAARNQLSDCTIAGRDSISLAARYPHGAPPRADNSGERADSPLQRDLLLRSLNGGYDEHNSVQDDAQNSQDSAGRLDRASDLGRCLANLASNAEGTEGAEGSAHHGEADFLAIEHGTYAASEEVCTGSKGASAEDTGNGCGREAGDSCDKGDGSGCLEDLVSHRVLAADVLDLLLVRGAVLWRHERHKLLVELVGASDALGFHNGVDIFELMVNANVDAVKTVVGLILNGADVCGQLLHAVGAVLIVCESDLIRSKHVRTLVEDGQADHVL